LKVIFALLDLKVKKKTLHKSRELGQK
jgi:hypothetical protein